MKTQYNITAKHIWLDETTGLTTSSRLSPRQIKFDSMAEYDLYRSLRPICDAFGVTIFKDCMVTLPNNGTHLKWLVDFKLLFPSAYSSALDSFLSSINKKETKLQIPVLYIEYKGVLTASATHKLDRLSGNDLDTNLIMMSDKPFTYIKENVPSNSYYIKPIFSSGFIVSMLKWHLLHTGR